MLIEIGNLRRISHSGDNTFSGLTKQVGQAATLTFEASKTQTVTGTLDLQGAPGDALSLRSSSIGTQWKIDPQGTRVVAFLDVKDSNNLNGTAVAATNTSVDSGNNTNWSFTGNLGSLWTGGGADNNWSTVGNWQSGSVPGANDIALFDGTSVKNATIDSSISVRGLGVMSGYTGTVTQGSGNTVTLGNGGYHQAAGTFTGSAATIDVNGPVVLSGGTLTATTGTMTVASNWKKTGGTFDSTTGTVTFDGAGAFTLESGGTGSGDDFNNLNVSLTGSELDLATNDVKALGNVSLNTGILDFNGKNLKVGGNFTRSTGTTLTTGSSTLTFDGSGNQTATFGTSQTLGTVKSDKTGGTLTFSTNGFTATTLDVSSGDTVKFQAGQTFTLTNLTLSGSAGNLVTLRSTGTYPTETYRINVSGTQTIAYADFKHCNASAGPIINATNNGVDSKFNTNVDFGAAPVLLIATSNSTNLTKVYLRYDQAMDSATAGNASNYSLSGGLTVSSASVSVDLKLVTLTASGNVTLGTTTVTASSSIKSLVQRNLANTVKTIEDGSSDGIAAADVVDIKITTEGNFSVIFSGPSFTFQNVPASIGEELIITAPGTTATAVDLVQIQEAGGTGVAYFGSSGTATTATVTTSGGTPNEARIIVRHGVKSAFQFDFSFRAFVSEVEKGAKYATCVKPSISPKCTAQHRSFQVIKTISTDPPIPGLELYSAHFAVNGTYASPTSFGGTNHILGSDGKTTFARYHPGMEIYFYFQWFALRTIASSIYAGCVDEDHYCNDNPTCPGGIHTGPNHGTVNSFWTCPCAYWLDKGILGLWEMFMRCGIPNSIDPSDGQKKLDIVDLDIQGRGFPYIFRRTYRSMHTRSNIVNYKDFGENWTYSYADEFLVKDGTGADNVSNFINYRDGHSGIMFVNTGTGTWGAQFSAFVQMRINASSDIEIREESGNLRVYHNFSTGTTPNTNGRLKRIEDRNGNFLTLLYDQIDPDNTVGGDEKYVLTRAIDTMGREVRYQYYAKTAQSTGGRTLTVATTNAGAYGRLQKVIDFKGDMDFDGTASSQDFSGQTNNRTLEFDYDTEGNLIQSTRPKVTGTPNGNDFSSGKTCRYKYILTSDLSTLVSGYGSMTSAQQSVVQRFMLHKLVRIWNPNEVKSTPGSNPADSDAAQVMTYNSSFSFAPSTSEFLTLGTFPGFISTYTIGGTNGNGVPSGGDIVYSYTNLNSNFSTTAGLSSNPVPHYNKQTVKVNITNKAGNQSEYIYGGGNNLLTYKAFTKGLRSGEPASYTITYTENKDKLLKSRSMPEGNVITYTFNENSADRFQQSNLIRTVITPGARGGDQTKIETVQVWEPIYNRVYMTISARGSDSTGNGYTAPISDPVTRTITDPYDATKTLNLRYASVLFFDYQESATSASAWGATSSFTPTTVDSVTVLATEVLLLRELGLAEGPTDTERANSVRTVRTRLSDNLMKLALGDLNGDNNTDPVISGNVVRQVMASPVLIANSNQHEMEKDIETAGDLIDQTLTYQNGGTFESSQGNRLQTIVTMFRYNSFGQPTSTISPEGNVSTFEYFAENDPDGDTVTTPTPADSRTLSTTTGGYLKEMFADNTRGAAGIPYYDQGGNDKSSATFNNNNTDPAEAPSKTGYTYDDVGNAVTVTNGRGIRTDFFVNEHDQSIQVTRAADISGAASASPSDPLYGHSDSQQALTAFAYLSRTFHDFNGSVVLTQVEDRNNTSGVDGNGLGTLPSQATDTTPGLSSADSAGGVAYLDSLSLYDRIDTLVESRVEVSSSQALVTKYRYDANQNRVLTIYPEGNADSAVYDERDQLFQSIRGTSTRPSAGLYASGDPTTFNRPGGSSTVTSIFTYNYDKNQNLTETVDSEDTDSDSSNGSVIAGAGDKTTITYDGFDRRKTVTDADGNISTNFYDPDSNVVRVIQDGDPIDDGVGTTGNKTLSVSEYIHDELSRVIASHSVLFQTPDVSPSRTPTLTDTSAMDSLAPYLNDASSDTASVPNSTGITVIGRVTSITEYDRESRVTFSVQDDLDVYRTDYDGASRVVKTEDSAKANGFASSAFDPANLDGNLVETAYDDNSNVIERLETDVTTISGVASESFRTTYIYDSLDRLQTVFSNSFIQDGSTSATAQAEDYRYDSRSNLVAKSDAKGPVNSRSFSRRGLGSTSSVTLNDFGNVSRTYYDGISRTLQTEAALTSGGSGDGTHIGATKEGKKDDGSVTASNLPTLDTAQSEDGLIDVFYSWDDNSQLLALRDDDGNSTGYIYDNQNRTLREIKGLAFTGTSFSISSGDSGTFRIASRPGSPGDPPVDTESSGTAIVYAYDKDSNVITTTDEETNIFSCTYDALNRKKTCSISLASGFVGTTSQTWKYDGLSRQTECFDNNSSGTSDDVTCGYFYDSLSRKVEETQTVGTVGPKAISCNFDIAASGSAGGCSADFYPDGRRVDNTYDRLDRLVDRKDNGQGSAIGTYAYIGKWRVATLTYQNETRLTHLGGGSGTTDVGFDGLRRIVNHRWESFTNQTPGNGTLLVGFEHQDGNAPAAPAYDRANNKKIEFKTHDGTNTFQEQYKYDSVYRLTSVGSGSQSANSRGFERGTFSSTARTSLSATTFFQDWDLDGLGNWQRQDDNARVETRNHSDFNELNQRTVSGNNSGLTYDKNGNTLDTGNTSISGQNFPGGGLRMTYDAFNRIKAVYDNVNTPGSTGDDTLEAEYVYDCHNRRMRKTISNAGIQGDQTNGTTHYWYHGWRVVEEGDASGNVVQQYVFGNYLDEVWTIDKRSGGITVADLNDGTGGQRHFYHSSTLYHVYALTDETGAIAEAVQSYDAYGKVSALITGAGTDGIWFTSDDVLAANPNVSAIGNPWFYTGQRIDPETGLGYHKNRFFMYDLGRWATRDPIGYEAGSHGLYEYVLSAPMYWVDSLGFGPVTDCVYSGIQGGKSYRSSYTCIFWCYCLYEFEGGGGVERSLRMGPWPGGKLKSEKVKDCYSAEMKAAAIMVASLECPEGPDCGDPEPETPQPKVPTPGIEVPVKKTEVEPPPVKRIPAEVKMPELIGEPVSGEGPATGAGLPFTPEVPPAPPTGPSVPSVPVKPGTRAPTIRPPINIKPYMPPVSPSVGGGMGGVAWRWWWRQWWRMFCEGHYCVDD